MHMCWHQGHSQILDSNRLTQIFTGLNEAYDHVRSQVLLLDPLPSINKVYSSALRVEKQREVHDIFSDVAYHTTPFVISPSFKLKVGVITSLPSLHPIVAPLLLVPCSPQNLSVTLILHTLIQKKIKKQLRHCDYCNVDGHIWDTCFRLHGYLEWYKECCNKLHTTNMTDTPLTSNTGARSSTSKYLVSTQATVSSLSF